MTTFINAEAIHIKIKLIVFFSITISCFENIRIAVGITIHKNPTAIPVKIPFTIFSVNIIFIDIFSNSINTIVNININTSGNSSAKNLQTAGILLGISTIPDRTAHPIKKIIILKVV
jgi:hypothetical protein